MIPTVLTALLPVTTLIMAAAAFPSIALSNPEPRNVSTIKAEIVTLARSFAGQGDEDFSRQKRLQPLVAELLRAAPQPLVKDRIDLLSGAWRQIWGPYDYRNSDARGIDPDTTPDEIYQVVFPGGYYWNVTPQRGSDKIVLLRGEYAPVGETNFVKARFTRFPGNKGRPEGLQLWKLAALAERRQLPNPVTIVPEFVVSLFFGGGYLREVYTDRDLRITYGGSSMADRSTEFIYVMERVGDVSNQ